MFQDVFLSPIEIIIVTPLKTAAGNVPLGDREVTFWYEYLLDRRFFHSHTRTNQSTFLRIHICCYLAGHPRERWCMTRQA